MKILALILALITLGLPLFGKDKEITILHTNDFHSAFDPIPAYWLEGSPKLGGAAYLSALINELREEEDTVFLFDSGDMFTGTLATLTKGEALLEMMMTMEYDALGIGNHEFDDGPETLRVFMDSVDFPVLMANANVDMEPELKDQLQKSTTLYQNNRKIGLIGINTVDTAELSSPGENVIFTDAVAAVQSEVDFLTEAGVNIIILLSHSSYGIDKMIAANTTGVDVIVGGHDNTYLSNVSDRAKGPYPTVVNGTQIVQAYAYGKFLGELSVLFDEAGNVIHASGEPIIIDGSVNENSQIIARLDELEKPINTLKETIVGTVSNPLTGDRAVCRIQECDMGNMIADAMRDAVIDKGYTIALQNSGGIRASLDAGDVTLGEIMTILPFQNTLSTFKVTGEQLLTAIENGVSQVEDVAGRFPQVSGMRYTFDPSKPANGGRVTSIEIDENGSWKPLDLNKTYGMVSNNFIRGGGDGYKVFRSASEIYDFGPDLADVVANYIKANPGYSGYTDNRITQE